MSHPPIPFARSYWVLPGKFLAGEYPGAKHPVEAREKLTALLECGIRHIINLMESDERDRQGDRFTPYKNDLKHLAEIRDCHVSIIRFPVPDLGTPSVDIMHAILDEIDRAIDDRRAVYVHCLAGFGRTGTVVGCYLIRQGMADSDTVLEKISRMRLECGGHAAFSPETTCQREMIMRWSE